MGKRGEKLGNVGKSGKVAKSGEKLEKVKSGEK